LFQITLLYGTMICQMMT